MGAYPDPEPKINLASPAIPWFLAGALGIAITYLLIQKPVAVVREVPKEVIRVVTKEVPKEVIVEKVTPLTKGELALLQLGRVVAATKNITEKNQLLKDIGAVNPSVLIHDTLRDKISVESLTNKLELKLRGYGIPIDKKKGAPLAFMVDCMESEAGLYITTTRLSIQEYGILTRMGEADPYFTNASVETWTMGQFGYAGKNKVAENVRDSLETVSDAFANAYLEQNPKK
jgi:hypothetical protein